LRAAESALRESEARLASANRMLQLVLDNIPVRVFWKDTELRFQGCNKAFAQDAGRKTPDDIIGLDDRDMPWAPEAEAYRRDDRAIMQSGVPKLGYEEPQTTPTGERIWLSTSKIPLLGDNGQAIGVMGVYTDITERKQDELALIEAREEADRANQAKSEFLSSMSHELRTPMNAILGFGQLMEYDDSLPEEHKDNVREILKGGYHLLDLINEVLDLAKLESGRIDLSLEPVEVCPLVQDCVGLVSALAGKRGIRIRHTGLEGVAVRADRTRLKQALLNLLSNAVKYNREGGDVRIDVQAEGIDRLRIRVTDSGPGIPATRLAQLFQPFNRLGAEATEIEGTGIGLTITRRIIEMIGGSVDVESEVGVGSTFWIELPLESAPGYGQDHAAAVDHGAPALAADAVQHTVLYIEDNPSNIKLVAQILGRRPHIHLLTAHTPELGIELALARHPELILLDINMPDMDGYQVLEVFKAEARLKTIPVVAITANAMPADLERGKAAGFVDYLTKPLDVGRFNAMLDRLLSPDSVKRDQP
jgi:PAS domain S-box-containing protein